MGYVNEIWTVFLFSHLVVHIIIMSIITVTKFLVWSHDILFQDQRLCKLK